MGIVGWIITGIFVGIILGAVLKMIKKKQRDKKGTNLKHKPLMLIAFLSPH